MTRDDIARALCCLGEPCRHPDACRRTETQLIPIPTAARVVSDLLCERWRNYQRDTMATETHHDR